MQQWQIGKTSPSLGELEFLISKYPWFSLARKEEYLLYLSSQGDYSPEWAKRVAAYVYSRKNLYREANNTQPENVEHEHSEVISSSKTKEDNIIQREGREHREIFVVGGDYFAKEDYSSVKDSEADVVGDMISSFSLESEVKTKVDVSNDQFSDDEFCTETLAKIYLTQGHFKRAMEVYDKLILLYPEKNTYFATLKDEVKKKYL